MYPNQVASSWGGPFWPAKSRLRPGLAAPQSWGEQPGRPSLIFTFTDFLDFFQSIKSFWVSEMAASSGMRKAGISRAGGDIEGDDAYVF